MDSSFDVFYLTQGPLLQNIICYTSQQFLWENGLVCSPDQASVRQYLGGRSSEAKSDMFDELLGKTQDTIFSIH